MPPSAPHPSMAVIDSDIYTRDDIRTLMRTAHPNPDPIPIESGGDNLAATFSPELADLTIHVIDTFAGQDIP